MKDDQNLNFPSLKENDLEAPSIDRNKLFETIEEYVIFLGKKPPNENPANERFHLK